MKTEELNLYALKYFFDAVDSQSLTKSSEINFVTRSAISQAVGRLEAWAGQKLTTHEKKNFRLTPEGEVFYRRMRASYIAFKKAVESSADLKGAIRVGCSASLVDTVLLPALKKNRSHQNLHLITGTTSSLRSQWEEGEINLALYVGESHRYPNEVRIGSGHFVLASPNGQMLPQIITTESRPEVREFHRLLSKEKGIEFNVVESWSLAAKLAIELKCCCLVPDFFLKNLKKVPLRGYNAKYETWILHKNREMLSENEILLLETIKEQAK